MKLSFKHLYGDKWGHLQKAGNKWEDPSITFPSGFMPEKGKKYDCDVISTLATFVYNDTNYAVFTARLKNSGNLLDKLDYKHRKREPEKTALQLAFENAK